MLMNLDDLYTAYLSVNACDQEIINIEKKYRHYQVPPGNWGGPRG